MKYLLLITTVLCSLCLSAQNAPLGLWVGEEYECVLRNLIGDVQPVDISWGIDDQHRDYFFVEENDDVYIIKPSRYFSGTATITCNFSFILGGITIQHPPVQWSFTCIDNPISLMPNTLSLEVGKTVRPFQYSHENELYANEAIVSFESEGSAIEVTPDGEVHAIQPGTAKVYARSNLSKEKSNPCIVTVTDSQVPEFAISLDQGNMTIEKGQSRSLYATVTPPDAEYTINWETSDPSVATVKKDSNNKNIASVTAKGKGQATISATIEGTDAKATCDVTVTITPTSIQMPQRNYALYVGEKMTVQPTVKPDDADYSLSWRSNDSDIAVVDPSTGEVTAKTVGTARITATIAGTNLSDYYNVSVDKPTLTLSATPPGGVVNKATRVKLVANNSEASIWYTLDGSAPNADSGKLYDSPIVINQSVKIKAIATHPDYNNSDVLTQNYVVRTAPGDVNEDRETNIADINAIIKVILNGYSDILEQQLADVNNDGEVNIADINRVIDVILNPDHYRLDVETFVANGVEFNMIYVEGGTFTMGKDKEPGDDDDEWSEQYWEWHYGPSHEVTVSSFKMGETEVTQELWEAVMGVNPSKYSVEHGYYDAAKYPVENISWYDCQEFIQKLNVLTGRNFRLPTEAEWEYAARGGNKSEGNLGVIGGGWFFYDEEYHDNPELLGQYYHPIVVGQHQNELGLCDMAGNVAEWCHDWYEPYGDKVQINPIGPLHGTERVTRGLSFNSLVYSNHSAVFREMGYPGGDEGEVGLRLVLSDVEIYTINDVSFAMIPVKGGTYSMGATPEQSDWAWEEEYPVHQVTLSSYSIGQTEVTQALWNAVMGKYTNPSVFIGDSLPVEHYVASGSGLLIEGPDIFYGFISRLSELTGKSFRLPTEAEWEFAARGGNQSKGYIFAGSDEPDEVAWTIYNSSEEHTHPVATLAPNELGLYDMSGNVAEYCCDYYDAYSEEPVIDPFGGDVDNIASIARGGSWHSLGTLCRVSSRGEIYNYIGDGTLGFRLVLSNVNNDYWSDH